MAACAKTSLDLRLFKIDFEDSWHACMTHLCVIRSWEFAGESTVTQSMVEVKSNLKLSQLAQFQLPS